MLDPAGSYEIATWEVLHNTGDTLLVHKPGGIADLAPGLAEDMSQVDPDGKGYVFKLRPDLRFNDGTPCDAHAVAWSIERVMRLNGGPSILVTEFVEKVVAVDDLTVKFVLKEPIAFFPLLVASPPYAPVSPKSYPADRLDEGNTSGGVGPYRIVRWERGVQLVLEANPNYYGTPPKTAKIIVRYFPHATALRAAIEAGDVDIAWRTLRPTDYVDMKQNSQLTVLEGPGMRIRFLCFNCKSGPFSERIVREAIYLAVDRESLVSVAFPDASNPLYSMVPVGMWSHAEVFPRRDLEKAKSLLAQAGYSPNQKLVTDLWYSPTHYGETEEAVAQSLKVALEETGLIQVDLKSAEWSAYVDNVRQGRMEFFLLGWYPDYLDPDNCTVPFARTGDSDRMGIFYSNKEMDTLMERGRTAFLELHSADRQKVYQDLQNRWATEVPTCPLFQSRQMVVTRRGIGGVTLDLTGFLHYDILYRQ